MASGYDLLRALAGIAPGAIGSAGGTPSAGRTESGTIDFQAMLERARAGTLESGVPVQIAPGASVSVSDEQLARLGPILDKLHSTGASHAIVAMDGRFLVVDVMTRQVRSEFDPASGELIEGIDAVVSAPKASKEDGIVPPPGFGVLSPSLAEALGREEAA